jgi:hypothetical protein
MVCVRIIMRNVTGVTLIIGVVLAAGCGPASSAPGDGHSLPPTPAGTPSATQAATASPGSPAGQDGPRLVLRGQISGGIAGRGGPGTLPEFSLYDDGSAIAPGDGLSGWVRPTEYRLTPAALKRLVDEANAAGLNRSRTVDRTGVADATYLTLTFRAGGGTATTRVIEVGTEHDPAELFWNRLRPQGTGIGFPKTDLVSAPGAYRPARLAVLATKTGQDTGERPANWPLAPLDRGEHVGGGLCTLLTGHEVDTAIKLLSAAGPATRWRSAGGTYVLRPRPLLPDERGCGALSP